MIVMRGLLVIVIAVCFGGTACAKERIYLMKTMMSRLLVGLMLLVGVNAWACNSFEECMDCINQDVFEDNVMCTSGSKIDVFKAIAYKLEEISTKMNCRTKLDNMCFPIQGCNVTKDSIKEGDVLSCDTSTVRVM